MHIEENKLEYYLLNKLKMKSTDIDEIQSHLADCNYCRQKLEDLRIFHNDFDKMISKGPIDFDYRTANELANMNLTSRKPGELSGRKSRIQISEKSIIISEQYPSFIQNIISFLKKYPFRSTGSFAVLATLGFYLFTNIIPTTPNPVFAKIENNILQVYNNEGSVIWTKGMPGIKDIRSDDALGEDKHRNLLLADIDGNGINEILITGEPVENSVPADTLFCYNPTGSLRWKTGGGDFIKFESPMWKHTKWYFRNFFVTSGKTGKVIIATINDRLFAPSKLVKFDPENGDILNTFYNSGAFTTELLHDIDNNGRKDVLAAGINNGLHSAFLAVFKPDSITGFSPSTDNYIPEGYQHSSFQHYIIFPRTKLSEIISNTTFNSVVRIETGQKNIIVYTRETFGTEPDLDAGLLYEFNYNMELLNVVGAVTFQHTYKKLLDEGKLTEPLDSNYYNKLKNSVVYFNN